MCEYIEGTFTLPVPSNASQEFLETLLKLGYKRCEVPLFAHEIKPLTPLPEPPALKFLERYQFSTNKGGTDDGRRNS